MLLSCTQYKKERESSWNKAVNNILSNGTNIDLEDGMKKTLNLLLADISLLLTEHDFVKLEEFIVKHLTK